MKSCLKILLWMAVAVLFTTIAWAQEPDNAAIDEAVNEWIALFKQLKPFIYICGAFGLLSIACAAFFGKMDWSRLTFIGIALLFVAGTGMIIDYLISSDAGKIDISFKTELEDSLALGGK